MTPDFEKMPAGLIPVIVQDAATLRVLMLGYMNRDALQRTRETRRVWFFSRSRQRLWMKGERSGNRLEVVDIAQDCDGDALLLKARPLGPVCHTGADTCFRETNQRSFLAGLENTIAARRERPEGPSYTASLFSKGLNAIAQKVGEEAVELIIEAKDQDDERFRNEAADLLFHYLILLQARNMRLSDIESVLATRSRPPEKP